MGVLLSARMGWIEQAHSGVPIPVAAGLFSSESKPQNHFVPIVKRVSPAVVNISTSRVVKSHNSTSPFSNDPFFKHFFGDEFSKQFRNPRRRKEQALGSGVIVDSKNGYIVTNNHVIAKADEIKVVLSDDREFIGKVVGTDPKTDIAVIKIKAKNLPSIKWGDSDSLEVGEYVLAIGNPFGLSQTITMGIVSAVGRANMGIADYEDFIQTDAAINPGNSGGALVNVNGELVGINTAIFSRSGGYMGIGFAVPSNMVKHVMTSLIDNGKVVRGWLGVSIQRISKDLAKEFGLKQAKGALVSEVIDAAPAAKGGIKAGDVIISFNSKSIDGPTELRNVVAATKVGKKINVIVIRDGRKKTLRIKTGEQPKDMVSMAEEKGDKKGPSSSALAGLEVRKLTQSTASELGLKYSQGVVISQVDPDSAAAEAGVRRGDVIVEINRKPVKNLSDFERVAKKIGKKDNALLRIKRRGGKVFIIIKPS